MMTTITSGKTKFWIICKEDMVLTQKLVNTIANWNLPGVATHIGHPPSPAQEETIAQADYAIFVTLCEHTCPTLQVTPITPARATVAKSPSAWLNSLKARYGSAPQSWWFQLPTTELSLKGIRTIPTEQALSQATRQIEVFVRNYYLQSLSVGSTTLEKTSDHAVTRVLQVAA